MLPAGQWMTVTRWPPAGAPAAGLANPGQNTQRIGHAVAGQCDIVFAITKSGLRCMAPMCNKPLCPWTTCPRDNLPFFSDRPARSGLQLGGYRWRAQPT